MDITVTAVTLDQITFTVDGKSVTLPVQVDVTQKAAEIKAGIEAQVKEYLRAYLTGLKQEKDEADRKEKIQAKLQSLVGKTFKVSLKEDGSEATEEPVDNV